jgi:hypothetical protein
VDRTPTTASTAATCARFTPGKVAASGPGGDPRAAQTPGDVSSRLEAARGAGELPRLTWQPASTRPVAPRRDSALRLARDLDLPGVPRGTASSGGTAAASIRSLRSLVHAELIGARPGFRPRPRNRLVLASPAQDHAPPRRGAARGFPVRALAPVIDEHERGWRARTVAREV